MNDDMQKRPDSSHLQRNSFTYHEVAATITYYNATPRSNIKSIGYIIYRNVI